MDPTKDRHAVDPRFIPENIEKELFLIEQGFIPEDNGRIEEYTYELDARVRLQRFLGILLQSYNFVKYNYPDNRNSLKIFMAPEFYFRPSKQYGNSDFAYSFADYRNIKNVLRNTILSEVTL